MRVAAGRSPAGSDVKIKTIHGDRRGTASSTKSFPRLLYAAIAATMRVSRTLLRTDSGSTIFDGEATVGPLDMFLELLLGAAWHICCEIYHDGAHWRSERRTASERRLASKPVLLGLGFSGRL